jgi:hypothetical protein
VNREYDPDDPYDAPPPTLDVDAVQRLHDRYRYLLRVVRWLVGGVAALLVVFLLVVGLTGDDRDDDDRDDDDSRGRAGTVVVRVLDGGELP